MSTWKPRARQSRTSQPMTAPGLFSEMLPPIRMGTSEGEHVWDTSQYAGRPRVQSQEAECVARATPTCQTSAAVGTVANEHRLQVSLHRRINERIHSREENLSAGADQCPGRRSAFSSPAQTQVEL